MHTHKKFLSFKDEYVKIKTIEIDTVNNELEGE